MSRNAIISAMLFATMLAASGCHQSGTWVDDPKNWERAFGYSKPKDVTVEKSIYWRSPHFTYEAGFHFLVRSNAALANLWTNAPQLRALTNAAFDPNLAFGPDRPDWFAPKKIDEYDVWVATNQYSQLRLLIDKQTRDMFIFDAQ